jgi:lipid-binding SYLF domain-containing protein
MTHTATARRHLLPTLCLITLAMLLSMSCSTYRKMPDAEKRAYLAELETTTLAELVTKSPEIQDEVDRAVGYAVFSNQATKVPVVGGGEGIGVVVDSETGDRSYLKVSRLDVGGGLGVRTYRLVILFFDREPLHKLAGGKVEVGAGIEAGAGDSDVGTGAGGIGGSKKEKYALYQLSEKGVSATFTVRVIKYSVLDLDD